MVTVIFTIGRILLILTPLGIVLVFLLGILIELLPWVQMARAFGPPHTPEPMNLSALNVLYHASIFLGGAYGVVPNRKLGHIVAAPTIASVCRVLDEWFYGDPLWAIPMTIPLVIYLVTYAVQNLPVGQDSSEPS
jgi:hypothetical protein